MPRRKFRIGLPHVIGIFITAFVALSIIMIGTQGFLGFLGVTFLWTIAIGFVVVIVLWRWFQQILRENPVVYWMLFFILIITGLALIVSVLGANIGVINLIIAAGMILSYVAQASSR